MLLMLRLVVSLLLVATSAPLFAATLDQNSDPSDANLGSYFFFEDREWGQTFIVGLSGDLKSVDLGIEIRGGSVGKIWIDLYLHQSNPLGIFLGQSSLVAAEDMITVGPGYSQRVIANFDFSSTNIELIAGTKYSLAVRTNITENFKLSWDIAPAYSRGEAFSVDLNAGILTPGDFSFATYIEQLPGCAPSGNRPPKCSDVSPVPVPATFPLLVVGVITLGFWPRKNKRP